MTTKALYPLFIFAITLFSFNNLQALTIENKRPTLEEMLERKWEFLAREAKLSPEETEIVKSIFSAYENKVWQLHERYQFNKSPKTVSDYEEMNDDYIEKETEKAKYLKEYHSQLKKVLSPEKLFNYYHAEKGYKRYLINEMRDQHSGRLPHGRGR